MTLNPTASDWAGARGQQWLAQIERMEAMLSPIDEPLIEALRLDAPLSIAELGSGGGATTLNILRHAPSGSKVHGFDVSHGLVAQACARAAGEQRVTFEVADVATARPAHAYDRLASRFGIMFFDQPEAAFTNLRAWLKPGGRFAFAAWGRVSENAWLTSVRDVVGAIVDLPDMNRDAPGGFRYGDPSKLLELLGSAGFSELEAREWRGALPIAGSPSEAAHFALASFSSFAELLHQAGEGALHEAQRALSASYAAQFGSGAIRMQACVRLFTGTRA